MVICDGNYSCYSKLGSLGSIIVNVQGSAQARGGRLDNTCNLKVSVNVDLEKLEFLLQIRVSKLELCAN